MFENFYNNPKACAVWNDFWPNVTTVFEHLQKFIELGVTEENAESIGYVWP